MINNINKPTSPFWGKVQASAILLGGLITGSANVAHIGWLQITGIVMMGIGGLVPIFMPNKQV